MTPNADNFRLSLGQRGEMFAWAYLMRQGYKLLEKNYRTKIGEIDVIAQKKGRIAFIEIKTRTAGSRFGLPEEAVHAIKQKKLIRLAQWYLKQKKCYDTSVSFDVLALTWHEEGQPEIRLIENAFTADD